MTASAVTAPPRPASPFKGLMPYTEEDAAFFFGRDEEIETVIANLEARRLTLLYGESGVGKSSLLRAGVVHRLRESAHRNLEETGTPELVPVYFAAWRDEPLAGLMEAVKRAVSAVLGEPAREVPQSRRLDEALKLWSAQAEADILVVLDQFEEYFVYRSLDRGERTFAGELSRAVNRPYLRARFLLSIREDALAKLDRFKREIPTLFGTYLRLRYLDPESAREAIRRPIEQYNGLAASADERVEIETELVEAVLDQVTAGRLVLEQAGVGAAGDGQDPGEERIETPYLQLVITRLWDEELRAASHVLRRATLEGLGGAERIVATHLDETMSVLSSPERHAAAGIFHYLVTPSGTKIALAPTDLAAYVSISVEEIRTVLERLSSSDVRILRPVPASTGEGQTRFEIFHDVLAGVILDWRTRYLEGRERADAVRVGVAGAVHVVTGLWWLFWTLIMIGGAIAEKDPLWLLGLIWSLSALVVWIGTTRVLLRRWRRRQRVIPALIIGELALLFAPVSFLVIVPVGLVRRRRRKRL